MANAFGPDDDDFDEATTPEWVKELRKKNRELEKANKQLSEELHGLKTESKTKVLADLLKEKGITPKAAKYFPADLDPTPENLAKWLETDGDAFAPAEAPQAQQGQEQQSAEAGETKGGEQESAPEVPAWMKQYMAIQAQEQAGDVAAPTSETQAQASLATAYQNAKSSTEFLDALNKGLVG